MKVVTPEDLLGEKRPKHLWHHGTCDDCGRKHVLVLHFGYDTRPERDYCICKNCLFKNIHYVLYGSHCFKDRLIDTKVKKE